jgi:hypothetical protein
LAVQETKGEAVIDPQPIECDGRIIAMLVHGEQGDYITPPIVFDVDGNLVMGVEVLAGVEESATIEHPVIEGLSTGELAELDQELAEVSVRLGLPLRTI